MAPGNGIVYLVGAGPGDPGLITVKGLACLRKAGVVIHDRLVHPDLLNEAAPTAELVDVGKQVAHHRYPQPDINRLLVEKARAGHTVVRLKGGDPFVFGRGGEECQALAEAGIRYEVVPGVTSAVAVPAYAGIPVTHRAFASSFTVITGRTSDAVGAAFDGPTVPRTGTLVCLMGAAHLAEIVRRLVVHGRPPVTPVAVVTWGTTGRQRVLEGTLADITDQAPDVEAPATIVVGEVVRLRHELDWFDPASRFRVEAGPLPVRPVAVPQWLAQTEEVE